ncbi:MAG: hypothetical protein NC123_16485 [Butyrivibrio sp.]|nr:hypothetical protein [Acetatifactor muris]MCM1561117.1 hypothetical protein [Butyrivibrio sp.]
MSRSELNLGKVGLSEAEIEEIKQDITKQLGGVRLGYNEEGKPGYYMKDETGADTVFPFSSGAGGGKLYFDTLTMVAFSFSGSPMAYGQNTSIRLDTAQYKKMTMSGGNITARAFSGTSKVKTKVEISGYKEGETTPEGLFSKETGQTSSSTTWVSVNIDETEINIEDYSEIIIVFIVLSGFGNGYASLNALILE